MKKGHFILTAAVIVSLAGIGISTAAMTFSAKSDMEEEIKDHGMLKAGITKSASVSFGVAEQTLTLDISALTGEPSSALQIEEVLVSAGQQVKKGTALFRVNADSVQNIRTILQKEILDTNKACEVLEARQKELRMLASQSDDNNVIDGKYAGIIYDNRCNELQNKVDEAKEAVDDKQNQINENLLELTQKQQELVEAQKYLKEAESAVLENYDCRYQNAYYYTVYEKTRKTAENMVDQLEEQIEIFTKKNESLLYEVDEALRAYHQIALDLEKEELAAKRDYDTMLHTSETASEWYAIQMTSLDHDLQKARERYQTALRNIHQFDAAIVRGQVLSGYNGIVSEILVEAGDTVSKNDSLITLYDKEALTMNVFVQETDYLAVNQKENVDISFADAPDQMYEGRITKVTHKNPYYIVTVTIQGDVSGISEGMKGDVTFSQSVFDNSSYNDVYFSYIGEKKNGRSKGGKLA